MRFDDGKKKGKKKGEKKGKKKEPRSGKSQLFGSVAQA